MGRSPFHELGPGIARFGRWSFADLVPYGVVLAEPNGVATWVNRAWTQLTGQTEKEWRGRGWLDVCEAADREVRWNALTTAARRGASHQVDWLISANGRGRRTLQVHAVPDREGGRLARIVITATDVTEERDRTARLLDLASHDSLTGLYNRGRFLEFVEHALMRRRRASGGIAAVLFVDVDDLKATNDLFGHDEGDRLLRDVAACIQASVRPADIVARYGGDEFTVLCEDLGDAAEADAIADRIRSSVRGAPRRGVSIGVALTEDPDADPAGLVKEADRAMYEGKDARRDRRVGAPKGPCAVQPAQADFTQFSVAGHEMSMPLTTISGLATMLRASCHRMERGDIDSALSIIEREAQRLELMFDQLAALSESPRHEPPLV